ncbi:MAG: hypothetical protein WC404_00040 [Candidatus Omnitrophota bacterium]
MTKGKNMIKYNIMYKPMLSGNRTFYATIVILAAFFLVISASASYGADKTSGVEDTFKSDDELIDQTRQEVEQYMKDEEEDPEGDLSSHVTTVIIEDEKAPKPVKEAPKEPQKSAEPIIVTEEPAVSSQPLMEVPVVKQEDLPVAAEPVVSSQPSTEVPVVKQEAPPAEPAISEENKGNVPSDVVPAAVKSDPLPANPTPADPPATDPSKDTQAKEIDLVLGKGVVVGKAMEEPVLKKMDVNKIGASPYYETYEGLRLLKYFTVAQRVEIYQEPRPIDSYILDAFAMRVIYPNTPWNIDSDYRTQLVPIFTRAYGTEVTISDPKNKEGQIRYTHDYREIYKNYWPKYQYQNSTLKKEMWDQNEVLLMHAKDIEPLGWLYTSNVGYRYSTLSAKSDIGYYEVRHTYFGSLSLAPTDKTEYFFQGEYYKSMHLKSTWDSRPDHFLGRTEVRIKSNDYKTMFVPQLSYSKDYYWPFKNTYQKYEIAFRVGRDWSKRLSTTTTVQYVFSDRDEPDNWGPTGYGSNNMNPHKDKAEYISLQNRLSYNVYDRLYVQLGLDFDNGLNWSIFDNWGLLTGLEYYAPGMIRVDVGWRGNHYYNLNDYMSSIYFKFYLFM